MISNLFKALEDKANPKESKGLKEGKGPSKSQLSLALVLAFMLSPIYLLVKKRLRDIRSWSRESIFEVGDC